uniref:RxLR effector protein n=1 Tax=Peronospora matthiolae TaxID=2874970 RepID=A0AAV1VDJ6_9STRA
MIKYFLLLVLAVVVSSGSEALSAAAAEMPMTPHLDQAAQSEPDDKRVLRDSGVTDEVAHGERFMLEFGALIKSGIARLISGLENWSAKNAMGMEYIAKLRTMLEHWGVLKKKPVTRDERVSHAKELVANEKSYDEMFKEGVDPDDLKTALHQKYKVDPSHMGASYYDVEQKVADYRAVLESHRKSSDKLRAASNMV